jgi:hypothetical protein
VSSASLTALLVPAQRHDIYNEIRPATYQTTGWLTMLGDLVDFDTLRCRSLLIDVLYHTMNKFRTEHRKGSNIFIILPLLSYFSYIDNWACVSGHVIALRQNLPHKARRSVPIHLLYNKVRVSDKTFHTVLVLDYCGSYSALGPFCQGGAGPGIPYRYPVS